MVEVIEMGTGPRALFVHGSLFGARSAWEAQKPLAETHHLMLFSRRGFDDRPTEGEDFEFDAVEVAEALGDGAHLVGHSYGGVVALLAAARRPEAVRSLVVSEPPALALAPDEPAVRDFIQGMKRLIAEAPPPLEGLMRFAKLVGSDVSRLPQPIPRALLDGAMLVIRARQPWEAQIPIEVLSAAPFPKLVISGGHSRIFDAPCDVLEESLPARRVVLPGAGHSIPRLGQPYNDAVFEFWRAAETPG